MASASGERCDQTVPNGDEEKEEEEESVRGIQSHYLRCPSPRYKTSVKHHSPDFCLKTKNLSGSLNVREHVKHIYAAFKASVERVQRIRCSCNHLNILI